MNSIKYLITSATLFAAFITQSAMAGPPVW